MRTWRRRGGLALLAAALFLGGSGPAAAEASEPVPPASRRLERDLRAVAGEAVRGEGHWTVIHQNVPVLVYAHEGHDRMRVVTPVVGTAELTADDLRTLLEANYSRALDARYAIAEDLVWGLYVHPLSTLTREELASAIDQVVALKKNYGTTYASTEKIFGRRPH